MQNKRNDLLEDGKMQDFYKSEPKSLQADARSAALKEWKLLDEEHRSMYQERAAGSLPAQSLLHQLYNTVWNVCWKVG